MQWRLACRPRNVLPLRVDGQADADELGQADAASTGIVTQEQIENRPISQPAEVLEVVPGPVPAPRRRQGEPAFSADSIWADYHCHPVEPRQVRIGLRGTFRARGAECSR